MIPLVGLLVPSVYGQQPLKQPEVTSQQIQKWLSDLDSDKFIVRENATHQLSSVPTDYLERISQEARDGSLEKSVRCIHVLRSFALQDEPKTEILASDLLYKLADSKIDRVSSYAFDVLQKIKPLKQERAIQVLTAVGVRFSTYSSQTGFTRTVSGPGIIIDRSFEGTDQDLHFLQYLYFIEDVQIENPEASEAWMDSISKMPNLRFMTLKDCTITPAMLAELEPVLPKIQYLRVYHSKLEGEISPWLKRMTSVQSVKFFGVGLDDQQQRIITAAFPAAAEDQVQFREGGFLGVSGSMDGARPCIVNSVSQDSGAYEAGLRSGDGIAKIGDTEVEDFGHLIRLLSGKKVGEKIEMDVLRRGQPLHLSVTLGKWPLTENYYP